MGWFLATIEVPANEQPRQCWNNIDSWEPESFPKGTRSPYSLHETCHADNGRVNLEKERLRPADEAAVHMKPFTCFMNIRSTRSSAESWATVCCWCCQSVRALASGKWRLQRPAYAGPPNVAKRVHQVKVGYHLYTVYTSHVNVSMLFAPHVWLKTRSESNWCPHKKSIIFTGQPCHSVLASFAFSTPISSLWHSPRCTTSSSAPPNTLPSGTVARNEEYGTIVTETPLTPPSAPGCRQQ